MPNHVLKCVEENRRAIEGYVLLREIKVFLEVGHDHYHPRAKIRIWLGTAPEQYPYSFELSHHVHTPQQAGPYHPSRVNFESEEEAINSAITALTSFLVGAISAGEEPADDWLVPNEDF